MQKCTSFLRLSASLPDKWLMPAMSIQKLVVRAVNAESAHHILIQPCHDNRDEDAAEKLLEEILFAVPVVKNKDTAVHIFPDGMYQSRKIQIQLAGNLIKY